MMLRLLPGGQYSGGFYFWLKGWFSKR